MTVPARLHFTRNDSHRKYLRVRKGILNSPATVREAEARHRCPSFRTEVGCPVLRGRSIDVGPLDRGRSNAAARGLAGGNPELDRRRQMTTMTADEFSPFIDPHGRTLPVAFDSHRHSAGLLAEQGSESFCVVICMMRHRGPKFTMRAFGRLRLQLLSDAVVKMPNIRARPVPLSVEIDGHGKDDARGAPQLCTIDQ